MPFEVLDNNLFPPGNGHQFSATIWRMRALILFPFDPCCQCATSRPFKKRDELLNEDTGSFPFSAKQEEENQLGGSTSQDVG